MLKRTQAYPVPLCIRCRANPRPRRSNWGAVEKAREFGRYFEVSDRHHLCHSCHDAEEEKRRKIRIRSLIAVRAVKMLKAWNHCECFLCNRAIGRDSVYGKVIASDFFAPVCRSCSGSCRKEPDVTDIQKAQN